jgi:hypothetical protein
MVTWPKPPATRILSWNQLVRENDPNFTRLSLQPWCFEFSNGRLFVDTLPTYTPYDIVEFLTDDQGRVVTDDQGNPVQIT